MKANFLLFYVNFRNAKIREQEEKNVFLPKSQQICRYHILNRSQNLQIVRTERRNLISMLLLSDFGKRIP